MSTTSRPTRDKQLARAFGARLQGLRSEREFSQLALATKSGVATTFVSALEQGRRQPSLMTIKKLAAGLGITMGDLLEGLDDDEKEMLIEARQEKLSEFISSWVEYSECLTLIFDTEKDTVEVKKL